MNNQIKVILYKLIKSKALYITALFYALLGVWSSLGPILYDGVAWTAQYGFLLFISSRNTLIISAIFAAYMLGKDFSNRTINNEVRIGYSRLSIILSRAIVILPATAILYFFTLIPCIIIFGVYNGFGFDTFIPVLLLRLVLFLVQTISVTVFALLFVFWTKKAAAGLIACFVFNVITDPHTFMFLENSFIFKLTSFYRIYMNNTDLMTSDIIISFISAILTITGVLIATYFIFRKAELK